MTTIFHFDDDGILLNSTGAATDPREPGRLVLPANTTTLPPPEAVGHTIPVFNGGGWDLIPDWRGKTYWLPDGSEHAIHTVGVEPPADALDEAPAPPLDQIRHQAGAVVDAAAETARLLFLTPGAGQAMTYQQKEVEADAILSDGAPSATDYPFLAACIGVDGDTLAEVGSVIRARRDAWVLAGAQIEQTRLHAKQAIRAATTPAEIDTILSTLTWPQPE